MGGVVGVAEAGAGAQLSAVPTPEEGVVSRLGGRPALDTVDSPARAYDVPVLPRR